MKITAFNGSPRAKGNTRRLLEIALAPLAEAGFDTEIVQVGGKALRGCLACGVCKKKQDRKCAQTHDEMNGFIEKMLESDGILIGSPTYFADVTTETKALIDRCGYVARANGNLLTGKVGAAVIAVRRTGGMTAFDTINRFFAVEGMLIQGSSYWNIGIGREPGDVEADEEGIQTMKDLGAAMAKTLTALRSR